MVCLIKFCTKHTHGVSYPAGVWNISSPLPVGVVQQKSLAEQHSCPCTPINIILIINGTNIQINILFTDFVMMLVLYVLKASVQIRVPLSYCHRPITTKLLCWYYLFHFWCFAKTVYIYIYYFPH